MRYTNKIVCPKCRGTQKVDGKFCTFCCAIGLKWIEPRPITYSEWKALEEFGGDTR